MKQGEDMEHIDWDKTALLSEIEYSKALKSQPTEYSRFIHLHNPYVPWSGDFNRAVGVKISDFQSFEEVVRQVESIHREKALEKPNRFDIYPPVLDESLWRNCYLQKGYRLTTVIFFSAPVQKYTLPSEFELKIPSQDEFIQWYLHQVQASDYFDEEWFEMIKPLKLHFSQIFRPYWLLKGDNLIGWVYYALMGNYARLFEVEIKEEFRGQGMGKLLLQAIRGEGHRNGAQFILLQSEESLRKFYESSGFQECSRNSIVWTVG